ncbi:MFS transporter [Streptomyces blastmyceticus]|uniref:MFS transporter n=1 Tax=Streptomyces blastmyceticus TaxID=68180 RepID=A0ABN0WI02_9ACTN
MPSVGRARWAIGGVVAGGVVVNFLDRTALSVASASIADEFALDLRQLGIVLSAFSWSYCLMQLPAGFLVDAFGVKRLTRIAAVLWGLASLLTSVAGGLGLVILSRTLLGIAEGPSMVGAAKATSSWFPTGERGMATALFDGATKLSNMVAFPVLAWVMSSWGWRAGFLFTGMLSLLFAAVWWWVYKEPCEHTRMSPGERAHIIAGGARDAERNTARQWRPALRSPRVWGLTLGFACYGYTINVVLTWMPQFFQQEFEAELLESGLYAMVPWGAATVAEILVGGWLVDRLVRRGRDPERVRRTVLTGGLAVGATIGWAGTSNSPAAAVLWMSVSLSGLAVAAPVAWSLPGLLAPPGAVGAVSGLMNFANTAASTGGVLLTGWLAEATGSFQSPFLFAVGVLTAGTLVYWRTLRPAPAAPRTAVAAYAGTHSPKSAAGNRSFGE